MEVTRVIIFLTNISETVQDIDMLWKTNSKSCIICRIAQVLTTSSDFHIANVCSKSLKGELNKKGVVENQAEN